MTTPKKRSATYAFITTFAVLAIFAIAMAVGVFNRPVGASALVVSCPAGVGWQASCG